MGLCTSVNTLSPFWDRAIHPESICNLFVSLKDRPLVTLFCSLKHLTALIFFECIISTSHKYVFNGACFMPSHSVQLYIDIGCSHGCPSGLLISTDIHLRSDKLLVSDSFSPLSAILILIHKWVQQTFQNNDIHIYLGIVNPYVPALFHQIDCIDQIMCITSYMTFTQNLFVIHPWNGTLLFNEYSMCAMSKCQFFSILWTSSNQSQ